MGADITHGTRNIITRNIVELSDFYRKLEAVSDESLEIINRCNGLVASPEHRDCQRTASALMGVSCNLRAARSLIADARSEIADAETAMAMRVTQ